MVAVFCCFFALPLFLLFASEAHAFAPHHQQTSFLSQRPYHRLPYLASSDQQQNDFNIKNNNAVVKQQTTEQKQPQQQRSSHEILQAKLARDLDRLSRLRPPEPSADLSANAAIISAGSSYTRLWTHATWVAHGDAPHRRYRKHLRRWPWSSTARKILPAVLLATAWSLLLCGVSAAMHFQHSNSNRWNHVLAATGSSQTFGFLSAPLVLLLTLRANASLGRLLEARALVGQWVLHARSLASVLKIHAFPRHPAATALAVRHLAVSGWILKASVRGESQASQDETVGTLLDPCSDDYRWLTRQPKRTTAVLSRIRQICAHLTTRTTVDGTVNSNSSNSLQLILEEKIAALEAVVGGCERLFSSPIPPTYSRHLSRVLCLWLCLMPVSLLGGGAAAAGSAGLHVVTGVVAATFLSSYVLIGIDEVGMEIEHCFQMLPLQQLAAAVQNEVRAQFLDDQGEMPAVID